MSLETERVLIGMALRDGAHLAAIAAAGVAPKSFEYPLHRSVWDAMLRQERDGQPTDLVAISMDFPDDVVELAGLATDAASQNPEYYARRLLNERWLQFAAQKLLDLAHSAAQRDPSAEFLDGFKKRLAATVGELEAAASGGGLVNAVDSIRSAIAQLEENILSREAGKNLGIPTGFATLDGVLGAGYRPGSMTSICGRSGKGKTTLALNSFAAAIAAGRRALFFTLEMPNHELTTKLLAREGKIPVSGLLNGIPSEAEVDRLGYTSQRLSTLTWGIDDTFAGDVDLLAQRVRSFHRVHGLDVIFVDYAQQLVCGDRRKSRREHIEASTARLKQVAIQLKVAVVLLAQINRVADQEDEVPGPHLIADSAAIEKDSDALVMIHHFEEGDSVLNVAKNRHGKDGVTFRIVCDWMTGSFFEAK